MERQRGLSENPSQGRRTAAAAASATPPPPVPLLRDASSFPNLSVPSAPTPSQVIALAREAMRDALDEHESQAAEATGVKPGLTIDLSRRNIQKLPDEVVDIIKNELERLALSHNALSSFPERFSECTSLRYLNVRQNKIKEFPLSLCHLRSLEILDLGRNKLRELPPDIVKLSSLKVFAIQKNMITQLPLCLADMPSLQVIKLDGNPLVFPPPEVLQVHATSPPHEGFLKDSEVTEMTVTAHIKRFLKQKTVSMNGRVESDMMGDESSEGNDTPRFPVRRAASGRFPIKVNGTDLPDLRSPNVLSSRPPPIPTRSHYRGLSQQNTATRRPGVMPLTIGNVNERMRSNSETVLRPSREERSESRSRRMGMISRKPSELGTLDETQANNRFSHYRGLSHGSAMQGKATGLTAKGPNSPAEPYLQRPVYVRRLSILPERWRESKIFDPALEAAKGILYSVFQIHPMIQMLMSLTSDGTAKRSSLEIVFYNTNAHVEALELEIQKHDASAEDGDTGQRENENVQRACLTLVNAYTHVCSLLAGNVDMFLDNGDPRYIRTLVTQLYNSIMELRVTCTQVLPTGGFRHAATMAAYGDLGKPRSREYSITPTAERPLYTRGPSGNFIYNPTNLRVATDVPIPHMNGSGRTTTLTSVTPRSGESFASSGSRGQMGDFSEEDRLFEKIFLSLQKSSDLVMRILPSLLTQFSGCVRAANGQRASEHVILCWRVLINKCSTSIQQTDALKAKLSSIKLKEPGIRTQASFWALCNNFIDAWYHLAKKIKDFFNDIHIPPDVRPRLRPIQQSMKETWELMLSSPWSYYLRHSGLGDAGITSPSYPGDLSGQNPLPMTPQSAALGPAVQATVPSTPQSGSFAAAFNGTFNGGLFERADALISRGGLHMGSRTGTMTSTSTASLHSMNSINSTLSSDSLATPSSMFSSHAGPFGVMPQRSMNGVKFGF